VLPLVGPATIGRRVTVPPLGALAATAAAPPAAPVDATPPPLRPTPDPWALGVAVRDRGPLDPADATLCRPAAASAGRRGALSAGLPAPRSFFWLARGWDREVRRAASRAAAAAGVAGFEPPAAVAAAGVAGFLPALPLPSAARTAVSPKSRESRGGAARAATTGRAVAGDTGFDGDGGGGAPLLGGGGGFDVTVAWLTGVPSS
jgi:hypothetical protein